MKLDTRVLPDLVSLSRARWKKHFAIIRKRSPNAGRFRSRYQADTRRRKCTRFGRRRRNIATRLPGIASIYFGVTSDMYPRSDPLEQLPYGARNFDLAVFRFPGKRASGARRICLLPKNAPRAYETELLKFFGSEPPAFDVQLLGIGPGRPHRFFISRIACFG